MRNTLAQFECAGPHLVDVGACGASVTSTDAGNDNFRSISRRAACTPIGGSQLPLSRIAEPWSVFELLGKAPERNPAVNRRGGVSARRREFLGVPLGVRGEPIGFLSHPKISVSNLRRWRQSLETQKPCGNRARNEASRECLSRRFAVNQRGSKFRTRTESSASRIRTYNPPVNRRVLESVRNRRKHSEY